MLGIFDSGKGALTVLRRVRALYPTADICVREDTENAPFGTKAPEELLRIVKRNIAALVGAGADRVLIGCCTASTVHDRLGRIERQISTPIIYPTAKRAVKESKGGHIGVICTHSTAESLAFTRHIRALSPKHKVTEVEAQELVTLIEGGANDGNLLPENIDVIERALRGIREASVDTLILGCTHFPLLKATVGSLLPGVALIDCAEAGAEFISPPSAGEGKTVYL